MLNLSYALAFSTEVGEGISARLVITPSGCNKSSLSLIQYVAVIFISGNAYEVMSKYSIVISWSPLTGTENKWITVHVLLFF